MPSPAIMQEEGDFFRKETMLSIPKPAFRSYESSHKDRVLAQSKYRFFTFLRDKLWARLFLCVVSTLSLIAPPPAFCTLVRKENNHLRATTALQRLSPEERSSLEEFFHHILIEQSLAFVLLGSKPMSFSHYYTLASHFPKSHSIYDTVYPFLAAIHPNNMRIKRGAEVWQKYKHFFPSPNFILSTYHSPDKTTVTVVLINRKNFLKKLEHHWADFSALLGPDMTPQLLLQKCQQDLPIIEEVLKNSDLPLGITLGFGRKNAELFQSRSKIEVSKQSNFSPLEKLERSPSEGFTSLEAELEALSQLLQPVGIVPGEPLHYLGLMPPGFVGDKNDIETKELIATYSKEYREISTLFKEDDLLELALERFVSKP